MTDYFLEVDEIYSNVKTAVLIQKKKLIEPTKDYTINFRTNPQDGVQLKRLSIDRFNGERDKWPTFKAKFCQFIHDNTTSSDITKFIRLDEHLEINSEAAELISGLSRVPEHYQVLGKDYAMNMTMNKKLLDSVLNKFIDLASASRGNLMTIINRVTHTVNALAQYPQVQVESWGPILVNLTVRKLDRATVARIDVKIFNNY